jgi:hypothetical protein
MTLDVTQHDATDAGIGFCSNQAYKYPEKKTESIAERNIVNQALV